MIDVFESFIIRLISEIPFSLYLILFFAFLLFSNIVFLTVGKREKIRLLLARFALAEYLFIIYCSTILFRSTEQYQIPNLTPLWKYKIYDNLGRMYLLPEIIMNLAAFIPFGYLLRLSFGNIKLRQVLLIGFLVSISIESLQFLFKLGMAEFDDVFNNSFGAGIGYFLYKLIYFVLNKNRKFNK